MKSLSRLVTSREQDQTRLGAVRAMPDLHLHDPVLIDTSHSSTQCTMPGQPLRLWRPATMDADTRLTITATASGAAGDLIWHAGTQDIDWPAGLPAEDGARYRINLALAPRAVELVLHRAPHDIQAGAPLIGWMESVGCRRQALLLLETLTASNQQ